MGFGVRASKVGGELAVPRQVQGDATGRAAQLPRLRATVQRAASMALLRLPSPTRGTPTAALPSLFGLLQMLRATRLAGSLLRGMRAEPSSQEQYLSHTGARADWFAIRLRLPTSAE